ncbi:insulinase, putative [Plasmodium gallinaceum]|uniref:Insulinase, putative n=1 Tax=Plasmodium gallinaceum TaxID=5849 RepID=A0A1J1GUP4_PLAGA|nr:insulinase, putative [Plasmodium gallinaceum]CRG96231.1 insulinase, putative [Plasmodium gallinaceum]
MHDYSRINHIKLEQELTVDEYYSLNSGLRIILSKIKSPKIYGYFTLLTEAENNEGLPHTLEHLIFLGSHKYPYKGLLDFLAYKCLSEGTNAWTSIDHTSYTIETFGIEGFCNILPIYLDFILNPTLEDDVFLSEVHHIFENGAHNGVVYSEMKSIENNCENIVERTMITNLYPNDKSGYRYETGGTLDGLRKTNNNRVREYFKKFYKLNNFAIIIFGDFENDTILNIIHDFEKYHLDLNPSQRKEEKENVKNNYDLCKEVFLQDIQSLNRPWSKKENVEKSNDTKIIKKYYPCNNLNNGQVSIGWRGCEWDQFKTKLSLGLLGNYLTHLTTSPLSKRLLEDKDTYCSSLDFSLEDLKENYFTIDIYDVSYKYKFHKNKVKEHDETNNLENQNNMQVINNIQDDNNNNNLKKEININTLNANNDKDENINNSLIVKDIKKYEQTNFSSNNNEVKINLVGDITRNCLKEVYDKPLNMERLKNIIIRSYLQHLRDLETSPQYLLNEFIIKYFIYGRNIEDLEKCLNLKKIYIDLLNENENYWKELLRTYFIDNNYTEVRCYPSRKKAKEIELSEKKLIENEQKKYGVEKLNKMVKNIKKIKENIEKKPPKSSLDIVPSAKAKNVKIEGITIFRNFKSLENETFINNNNSSEAYKNALNENMPLLNIIQNDLKRIIFPIQLSNIKSNFVSINVLINSNNVDADLKKYIPLLSYLLFETDVEINNKNVKCELFMEEMIRNTINYDCNYGLGESAKSFKAGNLSNILCIHIIGLLENYVKLFDLLFLSIFKMNLNIERLEIILKSAYQNLLQKKTKPKTLVLNLEYALRYMKNSNSGLVSIGQQELVLGIIENKSNLDELLNKLNALKNMLFDLKNISIIIDGDFHKIKNIFSWYDKWFNIDENSNYTVNTPVVNFCFQNNINEMNYQNSKYLDNEISYNNNNIKSYDQNSNISYNSNMNTLNVVENMEKKDNNKYISLGPNVHKSLKEYLDVQFESEDKNFKSNIIKDNAYNGIVCGIKSTDVSYLKLTVKVPSGYDHEHYCELLILREFFSMAEGPLYSSIRGGGYSYECSLDYNCILGELSLRIYRSSDVISALKEALKIFDYYCNNEMKEDELSIAKSSAYYSIFNNQETISDRASQTIFLSLKNLNLNFYETLLSKLENVTAKNILNVCRKYLSRIVNFRIDKNNALIGSTLSIICCSEKTEAIASSLRKDIKFGDICVLNITQLFHFFKTFDIESSLKASSANISNIEPENAESINGKDNLDNSEDNNDDDDDDDDDDNDDDNDDDDDTDDLLSSSNCSVLSDDDSYPGYSEN